MTTAKSLRESTSAGTADSVVRVAVCVLLLAAGCSRNGEEEYDPSQRALELNNRAVRALAEGDLKAALAYATQAVGLDPRFYQAHANRAAILREQDRTQDAAAVLEALVAMRPSYVDAYVPLGLYLEALEREPEAESHYRKAVELYDARLEAEPGDHRAAVNRAVAVYLLREPARALRGLRKVLAEEPEYEFAMAVKYRIEQGDRARFVQGFQKPAPAPKP